MEVNKGDRMVLNTIGQGGWEVEDNGRWDWAKEAGFTPDELLEVTSDNAEHSVVLGNSFFGHPSCKFALVHNHQHRGEQQ